MNNDLILLNGALGSKAQLVPLQEALSDTYNVHVLNFEGHGGKSTEVDFSIDLFAKNLVNYMAENNLSKVKVFGYSMGGYVALTAASAHPELFDQIVTLGTKFNWNPESSAQEVKMLNPEKIEAKVPHFAARLNELHQPDDWKKVMNKTAEMMLKMGDGAKTSDDTFASVSVDVVIGVGDKDNMVSVEESKHIADLIPKSQFKILEGVPHPIEMIDREVLREYLLKHIKN